MINSKGELIERLKDVRAVEIKARKNYEQDMTSFENIPIVNTITQIKKDEDKHIHILDKLISLLEK